METEWPCDISVRIDSFKWVQNLNPGPVADGIYVNWSVVST